jgi:beta-glucosidase/6-phospho-beta-glucosidase/beta-galactosidase
LIYLICRRLAFEREIERLQEEVEEIQDERTIKILQRAHELKKENEMLKDTLNQLLVMDGDEEGLNSEQKEYIAYQYYQALRMKKSEGSADDAQMSGQRKPGTFQTPD